MTLWAVARQAPLSMGFSGKEYQSGLPCLPPGDLPDPGIKPTSPTPPAWQADSLPAEPSGKPYGIDRQIDIKFGYRKRYLTLKIYL